MKKITLHTAAVDNGGTRREAGEDLGVGNGATQIAVARAEQLVHSRLAKAERAKASRAKAPVANKRAGARPKPATAAAPPAPAKAPASRGAGDDSGGL